MNTSTTAPDMDNMGLWEALIFCIRTIIVTLTMGIYKISVVGSNTSDILVSASSTGKRHMEAFEERSCSQLELQIKARAKAKKK